MTVAGPDDERVLQVVYGNSPTVFSEVRTGDGGTSWEPTGEGARERFRFRCPTCGQTVTMRADPEIDGSGPTSLSLLRRLVDAGITTVSIQWLDEGMRLMSGHTR